MSKRFTLVLAVGLLAATTAHAQYGGGGGGGRGGRGGHSQTSPTTSTPTPSSAAPTPPAKPLSSIQIVGEIKAIDAENNRITIAYEAVDALNWPAGTKPFEVSKTALLKTVTVGEKVIFRLDSQQISDMTPY